MTHVFPGGLLGFLAAPSGFRDSEPTWAQNLGPPHIRSESDWHYSSIIV